MKYLPILLLTLLGVVFRLVWSSYTGYTAEDAYITFQFARQLAVYHEFSFNLGQPIYGTTTPLLTFLLAVWYTFNTDLVLASRVLALVAFSGGLWFLYFSFQPKPAKLACLLVATSSLLISEEMSGMEMPLLFLFMMGSIYTLISDRPLLSGLLCGLLLLTRIDTCVFVAAMLVAHHLNRKPILPFLIGTLIYAPWLIFSFFYFGSPVPFTITAKSVAYGINPKPFVVHLEKTVDYLSIWFGVLILLGSLLLTRRTAFLAVFFIAQLIFLCFTGSTFFTRYFYTLTVTGLLIAALALARQPHSTWLGLLLCIVLFQPGLARNQQFLQRERMVHLQEIGTWLHHHTPPGATIQLEPLGYVGFHAQRVMLDEVGLITPAVVDLHRQRIGAENFYLYLGTDYILLQCGQAAKVMQDFSQAYTLIHEFREGTARACYEVWQKNGE